MLKLVNMDESNIEEMCKIADDIFYYVDDKPSTFFRNVLNKNLGDIKDKSTGEADTILYYAINLGDTVIGTIGLYHLSNEPQDTMWIGWFCILSKYRINGYGSKAMDLLKEIALSIGINNLKLYTSNHSEEVSAQFFYDKVGFKTYLEVPAEDNLVYIYKEMSL